MPFAQSIPLLHVPELRKSVLTATCSGVQVSRFTDFTLEICTPRLRWIPAHLMHKKIPKFHEAHLGPTNNIDSLSNEY